jgi:hypothetical protein
MDGFDIIIIFLIILLIIVCVWYYRGLFYGMCASGGRNCRTCCDRETDDYNRVESTADEENRVESTADEERVELSDSEETTPIKSEYNSLDLHF